MPQPIRQYLRLGRWNCRLVKGLSQKRWSQSFFPVAAPASQTLSDIPYSSSIAIKQTPKFGIIHTRNHPLRWGSLVENADWQRTRMPKKHRAQSRSRNPRQMNQRNQDKTPMAIHTGRYVFLSSEHCIASRLLNITVRSRPSDELEFPSSRTVPLSTFASIMTPVAR